MEGNKFDKSDLDNIKVFRALIEKGEFKLVGGAVLRVASLFQWFGGFDAKIQSALTAQSKAKGPKIKEIK